MRCFDQIIKIIEYKETNFKTLNVLVFQNYIYPPIILAPYK